MVSPDPSFGTHTTTRLLDALREPANNEPAWAHLSARYRPVIAGMARRLGLGDSAADDVAQQTLAEFVRMYRQGRYDRSKGRLGSWILSMARNISLAALRQGQRYVTPGQTALDALPGEDAVRGIWEEERDREILARAMDVLRDRSGRDDRTLLAFELYALRAVPAEETARRCGMTVEQVYVAKSRVARNLRDLIAEMTAAFEEDA